MDTVSTSQETVIFFNQAEVRAVAFRLGLVQRESGNHKLLAQELSNLWASVQNSYEAGSWQTVMAFQNALQPFLDLKGYWSQSLILNKWAGEASAALGEEVQVARLVHDRANILNQKGEYARAEELYQLSEARYRDLGEAVLSLHSRHMRSLVVRAQGRLPEAEQLCQSTISDAQALNLHRWLAHPLYVQGLLERDRGNYSKAQYLVEESLSRLVATDQLSMIAQCQHFLGELAWLQNNLATARQLLETSLKNSQQAGIERRIAATQRLLGDLARVEGRFETADDYYQSALKTATMIGDKPQEARLLLSRGMLSAKLENNIEAIALFQGAVAIYEEIGDGRGAAAGLFLIARSRIWQRQLLAGLKSAAGSLTTAWKAGLVNPTSIVGIIKRKGSW